MKKLLFLLSIVGVLVLLAAPAFAADDMTCGQMDATIASLHQCVQHAQEMGHITNAGVATSLLAKLDAAQAALDRGQTDVAISLLNAFISDVSAQSDKLIAADHAAHMVMHAQMVIIMALGG
jgi:hypothetical protein